MSTSLDPAEVDELFNQVAIPTALKAASISLGAGGLLLALVGLQNVTFVQWAGSWAFIPVGLMVAGACAIGVAAKLVRGRRWALSAGLAAAVVLAMSSVGFALLQAISGIFASLTVFATAGCVCALVFTILAIGPFRSLMEVRRKLREAGHDVDL